MTKQQYQKLMEYWQRRPGQAAALKLTAKSFTGLVYAAYAGLELFLLLNRDGRFWRTTLVPLAVFLAGSLLRSVINAPRPYEVFELPPLTPKDTRGKSFPSRHVFSAGVIAMAFWWISPGLGGMLLTVALVIAASRVLTGVHFPRDVLAGLGFGLCLGWLGFFVF